MARRRTLLRIPFLKFKINKQTIFNIIGFIFAGAGLLSLVALFSKASPAADGRLLDRINSLLSEKVGGMRFFIPFLFFLTGGHFFNTRKLRFIKPNITLGLMLIFASFLGVFRSGEYGKFVFDSLSQDFSVLGSIVILGFAFVIGLILFLDTSIDVFVLFLFDVGKGIYAFIKQYLFRGVGEKKAAKSEEKEKPEFIQDEKVVQKKEEISVKPQQDKQITIRPIAPNTSSTWVYPPMSLLVDIAQQSADRGDVKKNATDIEKTLDSFGIRARVVEMNPGPAVTQYALQITQGTKLSKITALSNDLALALAATTGQVRIEAPIPGRSLVGVEIPNIKPEIATLKRLLQSPLFTENNDPLLVPLGLDVSGQPQAYSIGKMPHALIAGTTGSGKSVLLNAWISTFLFRTRPEELQLILVDPKRVELTLYNGIPHLLTEVIVEGDKIISALRWTIGEMTTRYKIFSQVGVRNLEGYNSLEGVEKKPYIVFIIDELADLMIFAPGEAEELITRIAQMARATGIHLLLATQRPSVDIITGLMKANIPTRVAFKVASMVDSRVIIDMPGAEKLLGKGDMLFLPPDQAKPRRIQGPFITEREVNQLVKFLKAQSPEVHYTEEVLEQDTSLSNRRGGTTVTIDGEDKDVLFDKALEVIMKRNQASASNLQRFLKVGYARAARILDQLEAAGYIGPYSGSKPREILRRAPQQEES